jgi:hypothetical protein
MMPRAFLLPREGDLSSEPQLASLAVLEVAANVTILALSAQYPELASPEVDLREPGELCAALDLIDLAGALHLTIARYRRALAIRHQRLRQEQEQIPF